MMQHLGPRVRMKSQQTRSIMMNNMADSVDQCVRNQLTVVSGQKPADRRVPLGAVKWSTRHDQG